MADLNQDDITKGFEEEQLSRAEIERRQAAFQREMQQKMQIILKPKQFDKNQRRDAIRWLGEAGQPDAISALVKVYQKDKTPGFKEEAAYALGQIKAMGEALSDPETENEAYDSIEKIAIYGKFGGRANPTPLIITEVVLVILAFVLFAVGIGLSATVGQERRNNQATAFSQTETARPTATPDTEDIVRAQLQTYYEELLDDANTYQTQLAAVGRNEGQDCAEGLFNYPSVYTLSPLWAGNESYVRVVTLLNEAHDLLDSVNQPYQNACFNNRPLPREDALTYGDSVLEAQRKLREARDALNAAGIEVTQEALITNTPRPTDTPEIEPTRDISSVNNHIVSMELIINEMISLQGPATRLEFYWQQVVTNNALYLSGCNQPEETIPNNYSLPVDVQGQFTQLDSAVTNLNLGLDTLRIVQDTFYSACRAGTYPEDAAARLQQASFAITAFESARDELDALRGR